MKERAIESERKDSSDHHTKKIQLVKMREFYIFQ